MDTLPTVTAGKRRRGVCAIKKRVPRADMTPMVDLGFLLITFFVFTTSMETPTQTTLVIPDDNKVPPIPTVIGETTVLTVMPVGRDRIFYYEGSWEDAMRRDAIHETGYDVYRGLGQVIRDKQQALDNNPSVPGGRNEMLLMVKPGKEASYGNLVDVLDEVLINNVRRYAIVKTEPEEIRFLEDH